MSDRGIKKWAPYASIIEQRPILEKHMINKNRCEKPTILDDEAEYINQILLEKPYKTHIFSIYENGYIYEVELTIKKIDLNNRTVLFDNDYKTFIDNIVSVKQDI